jgi:Putative peptidoglycan binding domain
LTTVCGSRRKRRTKFVHILHWISFAEETAMPKQISGSVGIGGRNIPADVAAVQYLLDCVPTSRGGPTPELVIDGACGPKTTNAIRNFQLMTGCPPDGRVDPGGPTFRTLASYDPYPNQSLPPMGQSTGKAGYGPPGKGGSGAGGKGSGFGPPGGGFGPGGKGGGSYPPGKSGGFGDSGGGFGKTGYGSGPPGKGDPYDNGGLFGGGGPSAKGGAGGKWGG